MYGVDRKICHSGSLLGITRQASWCRSVTLVTDFSIHTIHTWKILIIFTYNIDILKQRTCLVGTWQKWRHINVDDVMTSYRRWYDAILALYAHGVDAGIAEPMSEHRMSLINIRWHAWLSSNTALGRLSQQQIHYVLQSGKTTQNVFTGLQLLHHCLRISITSQIRLTTRHWRYTHGTNTKLLLL